MHEPSRPAEELLGATDEEIASAIAHALRFDARGKARRGGGDLAASFAAERLIEHLRQSGFVLGLRQPSQEVWQPPINVVDVEGGDRQDPLPPRRCRRSA